MTEIWDLALLQRDSILITGGSDAELKIWSLEFAGLNDEGETSIKYVSRETNSKKGKVDSEEEEASPDGGEKAPETDELEDDNSLLTIKRLGSILRSSEGRVHHLTTDKHGRILATHGTDNVLELFIVCNEEEIQKRLAKRVRKEKKRTGTDLDVASVKPTVQEQFRRVKPVKASGKVRSVNVLSGKKEARVLLVLANNQVEVLTYRGAGDGEIESLSKIETPGHRSDVRTLSFSSDNTALLTASAEGIKVWAHWVFHFFLFRR